MKPPSSYLYAALASLLLTGASAPVMAPQKATPLPRVRPPQSTPHTAIPPRIAIRPNSVMPDMTRIPKSFLVSELEERGHQTFFTGPSGAVVVGPVDIRLVPCKAAIAVPHSPMNAPSVASSAQR